MQKKSICFYFQVHQPYRLSEVSHFAAENTEFFSGPSEASNLEVFEKVAKKCYLPTTNLLYFLLKKHPEFRISFSFSGVFLKQCEEFGAIGQSVLKAFKKLVKTGQVEILGETFYHSLSFLFSWEEYAAQIQMHRKKIEEHFGITPKMFRNTELIYRDDIGEFVRQMGFSGMLVEGWEKYLHGRNPNQVFVGHSEKLSPKILKIVEKYAFAEPQKKLKLLLKNYSLSDDIAFRFSNQNWDEHPLSTEKFVSWVEKEKGKNINLFMDYETFGEHQWKESGIFDFLQHLPEKAKEKNISFKTPSESIKNTKSEHEYEVAEYLSWADSDRDISAWLENSIQHSALEELSKLDELISPLRHQTQKEILDLLHDFRKLQTSDHLYYMCTKYFCDGDVHAYFSPYNSEYSPYEAYLHFMNTARKLKKRIVSASRKKILS